jgi:hypothetical protein
MENTQKGEKVSKLGISRIKMAENEKKYKVFILILDGLIKL